MSCFTSPVLRLFTIIAALSILFCATLLNRSAIATSSASHRDVTQALNKASSNPDLILFRRGTLNTRSRTDLDTSASDALLSSRATAGNIVSRSKPLRIVQFAGPIKRAWIDKLKSTGVELISYIPNNAYIVRGTPVQLARAVTLNGKERADDNRPVRWMGSFEAVQKIDPVYDDALLSASGDASANVEIELIDAPESSNAIDYINSITEKINRAPRRMLRSVVLSVTIPVTHLQQAAALDEVLFIGPAPQFTLLDERSAQIVAANVTAGTLEPSGPGYKDWLQSKGLDTVSDFVIDVTDTGLDRGSTASTLVHPDFRNAQGNSRVAYNISYHNAGSPIDDRVGHGSIVASVAVGLGSSDRKDSAGYMYGLGVDPNAQVGASKVFGEHNRLPFQFSFITSVSAAYARGARISNNSWGAGGNSYDVSAREFDILTRDAQPQVPGNQEMFFVFAAGNEGPGGKLHSPGTAKNVITVAASENFRPEGFDSCNLDGQGGIGPDGADNILDILRFSSGGPTDGGRIKPDIAAPGTHIYGAASQAPLFNGAALCPGVPIFQPPGQQLYTWSSGTSLATPHVAGAAALVRRFFTIHDLLGEGIAPSPAMTKAFLINATRYMSGENAGGDLPSMRQGWGLIDLGRAFDETARSLVDQTQLFTESGQDFKVGGSLADRTQPLRVTLVWTDAPGSLAGPALTNDLDLEVKVGNVTIYRGNVYEGDSAVEGGTADRLNNVESISIPAELIPTGAAGNFTVTVRAANIAGDGVPGNGSDMDQDFALVIYNISDPVIDPPPPPPPPLSPAINSAAYTKKVLTITGQRFGATARVEINGQLITKPFTFDASTNSLIIKLKKKKLKLVTGNNQIVVIENNLRSQPFTLQL